MPTFHMQEASEIDPRFQVTDIAGQTALVRGPRRIDVLLLEGGSA
jgi:hypothetical protein